MEDSDAFAAFGPALVPSSAGRQILSSGNLASQIGSWLPPQRLLGFRRIHRGTRDAVQALLATHEAIRKELDEVLRSALGQCDNRVWVGIRVRPNANENSTLQVEKKCVTQQLGSTSATFFFDQVFGESARQADVWSSIQGPIMRSLLRKEHVCLFAYGQTGSGKTHTVFGDPSSAETAGIAFRITGCLSKVLQHTADPEAEEEPHVEFSFLEVYNEKVHDLLANSKLCHLAGEREELAPGSQFKAPTLSAEERVVVRGLTRRRCDSDQLTQQISAWLAEGAASRIVGRTAFNARSSRSHAVATIHICWNDPQKRGAETRLYIVDLAGSERSGQYATNTEQLREGAHINLSLSTLGRVVGALARGRGDHIPSRDSALTWLLTDAITGHNARAFMIAAVQPQHEAETLSTLRYAQAYSSLQSDLSTKLPRLKGQVRDLQRRAQRARHELDSLCFEINTNTRIGKTTEWNRETLKSRVVRIERRGEEHFQGHPYLKWTEAHAMKAVLQHAGVVAEVSVPVPREADEPKDGRRRRFSERLVTGSCAKVIFAGRHGYPGVELWLPEAALEEVSPHPRLRELLSNFERAEVALQQKQHQLELAQKAFATQLKEWMD